MAAYLGPLFCEGKGLFSWVALSGDPADISATDRAVADLVMLDAPSHIDIPYRPGTNLVWAVLKDGAVVVRDDDQGRCDHCRSSTTNTEEL